MTKFEEKLCDKVVAAMLIFAAEHPLDDDYYTRAFHCMPTVGIHTAFFEALISPQKNSPIRNWIYDPVVLEKLRLALKAPDIETLWWDYKNSYRQLCRIKDTCRDESEWGALAAMLAIPPEELRWRVNHATLPWSTVSRAVRIVTHPSFEGLCESFRKEVLN